MDLTFSAAPDPTVIAHLKNKHRILPGTSATYRVHFIVPKSLPARTYYPNAVDMLGDQSINQGATMTLTVT